MGIRLNSAVTPETHVPARNYVGRFAPSPTGPLHFGSLVAAVGSYLQSRASNGKWLLRIEDLDTPRVVPGMAERIVRVLEQFGFEWDGSIEYQSRRLSLYAQALAALRQRNLIYSCSCSRTQIAALDEQRYPGTCRHGVQRPGEPIAQRFRVEPETVTFDDLLQGHFSQNVSAEVGDFVVQRRDSIFAYHLAVVVDDAEQGVTEVVRGADLLDSTPRQILLQRALRVPTPRYCHLPLALDKDGQKLSKSAQSLAIDGDRPVLVLWHAFAFLRQSPPDALQRASRDELWAWAKTQWNLARMRQIKSDRAPNPE